MCRRRNPSSDHRHGTEYLCDLQCVCGRVLHSVRWAILRRLHGRHPAVLHLHRALDVHSVRVGQPACEAAQLHGYRLDRTRRH